MGDDEELRVMRVASLLCLLYGDHGAVPCECADEQREICHFACDFMDDAEKVIAAVRRPVT